MHLLQEPTYDKIIVARLRKFVLFERISAAIKGELVLFLLGGVFLRDVSCYFSVLEEGQPREKLECWFHLLFTAFCDDYESLVY